MKFINAEVFVDGKFQKVDFEVNEDRFTLIKDNLSSDNDNDCIDCEGKLILPGFIDIHSHGCVGYDFINANVNEIEKMCEFYAGNGITSILATTMTIDPEIHKQAMRNIKQAIDSKVKGSRIVGINMEGPFLGLDKRGAHDPKFLMDIDDDFFDELNQLSGNNIRIVDIDPKLSHSKEFIEKYSDSLTVSLAHTSCNYDTANKAIEAGASHVTHLFNAMNGLHHREPGIVGAVSDNEVHAEIICDGIHIHPSVIRLMFKADADKLILISDSMCAAGLEDGIYELGGQKVVVKDYKATLEDGTIAGSTVNVYEALKRAIRFGVPKEKAILSATMIPAQSIKAEDQIGSIAVGKKADFIILDPDYNIEKVYLDGALI
ncbi:N-acetylglucosamine-6-phosphate deacetylase [Anaerocolumna sp.]|uniref:N-acetylglucosamine-6-phosphate deacetylase n=1 Tax=Anaerocolumna sp. TaxID=2041569 RepID=UPI0028A8954A|nr:N-acetylglucosamine-6-phosphate deacetylase [Anaerocolumna sp.]